MLDSGSSLVIQDLFEVLLGGDGEALHAAHCQLWKHTLKRFLFFIVLSALLKLAQRMLSRCARGLIVIPRLTVLE